MRHSKFHIGLEFISSGGFRWRCTDVGTRTIVAICLDRKDQAWYRGPPYIVEEVVFDEKEIERCHLTHRAAAAASKEAMKEQSHPGYPAEVVFEMIKASTPHYPHAALLRFDRRRGDGEILHPFAGKTNGDDWIVDIYLPFAGTYASMSERDFIALPLATKDDIRIRASKLPVGDH